MKKPPQALPQHLTKISYILPKRDKPRLVRAAKRYGCSMSQVITLALEQYFRKGDAVPRKVA